MNRRRPYRWRTIHASGLSLTGASPRRRVIQMRGWRLAVFDPEVLVVFLWADGHWYEVDVERKGFAGWDDHLRGKIWYTPSHGDDLAAAYNFAVVWMTLCRLDRGARVEVVDRPWTPPRRARRLPVAP